MRRKRPYTEPDRIKERIRVIDERQAMASIIKAHGDIPYRHNLFDLNDRGRLG